MTLRNTEQFVLKEGLYMDNFHTDLQFQALSLVCKLIREDDIAKIYTQLELLQFHLK